MFCPRCGNETKVIASHGGNIRERTRKCECNYVFNTIEIVKTDISLINYLKEVIKYDIVDKNIKNKL